MSSVWLSAWKMPHLIPAALMDRIPVGTWSMSQGNNRWESTLEFSVAKEWSEREEIFKVDDSNHLNDVGSVIHFHHSDVLTVGGLPKPVASYLLDRDAQSIVDDATGEISFTANHLLTLFQYVTLHAYDFPRQPSIELDWHWGHDSVLSNGDFESNSPQSEVQGFWFDTDGNGDFTITSGTFTITLAGNTTNAIDWIDTGPNPTRTIADLRDDIETELELLPNTIDVSVSGGGKDDDPFLITFRDPPGDYAEITIDDSLLVGGGVAGIETDTGGDDFEISGWTRSINLARNDTPHARYAGNGFRLSVDGEPVRSGEYSLRVNGLSIYAGAMQRVRVVPGQRYNASVWINTSSTTDMFRLVIRDTLETFIASSHGLSGTTIPANTWTEFRIDEFIPHTSDILFRVAVIGTGGVAGQQGNPLPFFIDDATLAPGAPATTIGDIWLQILQDAQSDHSTIRPDPIPNVVPTFDAINDSNGTPWSLSHSVSLREGADYLGIVESTNEEFGYQYDLRFDPDDEGFYFDAFEPGTMGTVHPAGHPSIVVGPGVLGGELVRSSSTGSYVLGRGGGGHWGLNQNANTRISWGSREIYLRNPDLQSPTDISAFSQQTLDHATRVMTAGSFKIDPEIQDEPLVEYVAGDTLTVAPGSDTGLSSMQRLVENIRARGEGDQITELTVEVNNEVLGSYGLAAQAKLVNRLWRRYQRYPLYNLGQGGLPLGGLGDSPFIVVAGAGASEDARALADFTCDGTNDELVLIDAAALAAGQRPILVIEELFLELDGSTTSAANAALSTVHIMGVTGLNSKLSAISSTSDDSTNNRLALSVGGGSIFENIEIETYNRGFCIYSISGGSDATRLVNCGLKNTSGFADAGPVRAGFSMDLEDCHSDNSSGPVVVFPDASLCSVAGFRAYSSDAGLFAMESPGANSQITAVIDGLYLENCNGTIIDFDVNAAFGQTYFDVRNVVGYYSEGTMRINGGEVSIDGVRLHASYRFAGGPMLEVSNVTNLRLTNYTAGGEMADATSDMVSLVNVDGLEVRGVRAVMPYAGPSNVFQDVLSLDAACSDGIVRDVSGIAAAYTGALINDAGATNIDYGGGGVASIDDLSDVDTTTTAPTTGDVLEWDGTNWVPGDGGAGALNDLSDVTITSPAEGDALRYDSGSGEFRNKPPADFHSHIRVERITSDQTLSDSVITTLINNSIAEEDDADNDYSYNTGTGVLTINTTGIYIIGVSANYDLGAVGARRFARLNKNSGTIIAQGDGPDVTAGARNVQFSVVAKLAATDTLMVEGLIDTTDSSSKPYKATGNSSYMTVTRIA